MHILNRVGKKFLTSLTIGVLEIIAFGPATALMQAQENVAKPSPAPTSTAESANRTITKPVAGLENPAEKQFVRVTIATSRSEVTRNHAWGLTADIRNISSQQITLFANEVQLVMQPEATQDTNCNAAYQSFLPNTKGEQKSDSEVILQPGEHYMFFWSGVDISSAPSGDCRMGRWGRLAETLNFIPGPYSFAVVGRLHLADQTAGYHTFGEAVSVRLGIEQLTIMLFAGIGAVLAYSVVALQTNGDVDQVRTATPGIARAKAWLAIIRNLGSSFLLGAVLAVVANRLSDTQFPVKVSVNDVWGALTVGFVFYFIGNKLIDKLKTLGPTTNANPNPHPNPKPDQ